MSREHSSGDAEHTECAVCGYEPDPDRVPPHYVLSLSEEDTDDEYVRSYPFGGSLSVPFACSDECWLDAQDDPELVADGGTWEHLGNPACHDEQFRCTRCGRKRSISNRSDQWQEHGEPEPCGCAVDEAPDQPEGSR